MIGIILLATIGSLIFSLIAYALGYYGGEKIINKIYIKYAKSRKGIDKCKYLFTKYSKSSIFFARMLPFSRTYVSLIAGACKQNLLSYIFFSLFGIFVWNTLLISLGFSFIKTFYFIEEIYRNCKILILSIISVSIMSFIMWKNSIK